ncbi:unnamed protein product, partial [Didymodactylos carnosus]
FDQLSEAVIFTKFDFKSGYFQIPLAKEDRPKTAFSTRDNHYQFTVLPQGVTNGLATFQRVINHILGPTRWRYALAYIDDIIIYSRTFEDHLSHLKEICQLVKEANFRLNSEKCEVARTQTDYLGHQIKQGDIRPSPVNIRGLLHTELPTAEDQDLIAEYDYIVQHIKGINNAMPDYLSRSSVDDAEEDLDENIFVCSKSTQTDVESLTAILVPVSEGTPYYSIYPRSIARSTTPG